MVILFPFTEHIGTFLSYFTKETFLFKYDSFLKKLFIDFFGCTGSSLLCGLPSSGEQGDSSLVLEHRPWSAQASVVAGPWLQSTGSIVVAHRLSCSTTCGIFLDQESNSCLLHWKVDSLPLSHQGSPINMILI